MPYRRLALSLLIVLAVVATILSVGSRAEKPVQGPAVQTAPELPAKSVPRLPGKAANRPPAARYASVLIKNVPHVRQKPDFCGEACAASYLQHLGHRVDQDYVFDRAGLDPIRGRGCYTVDLVKALRNIGFTVGPVWYKVPAATHAAGMEAQWKALHADLARGAPSIICTHYDDSPKTTEHFRLILGYDAKTDEVIYHEPGLANGAYRRMKRDVLLKIWPLKYSAKEWTVIRMPLAHHKLPPVRSATGFTDADYAQHIMQLKKKIPNKDFTIVIQRPFVVIGDESPAMVKRRAEGTVKWAVDRLKRAYFTKDPNDILDIWLFKDKPSYRKYTKEIFNYEPDTPYGYFSDTEKALVMNIATGGGTLVHEIVHPFVASNFPECPSWLNEGLGSLYEQSGTRDNEIIGLTNWRLAGLQDAIRRKKVPSFKSLCSTTTHQFYNKDPGTNYSQARYLCYYLQEHRLLRKFYHKFHANCKKDPTGYNTLKEILGRRDMDEFKKDWEAYVMKLRFP